MVHHLVVDRGSHHSHKPSAHVEVELFGCAVAAVNHTQEVGDMVVTVPFRQTVEIAFDGMVLFDAVAGEIGVERLHVGVETGTLQLYPKGVFGSIGQYVER